MADQAYNAWAAGPGEALLRFFRASAGKELALELVA
jgi:hypothetical protein